MTKCSLVSCSLALLTLLFLSGCASMYSSETDQVTFDSEPEGATVKFNGRNLGTTPCTATLKRQNEAAYVTFQKSGYSSQTINLRRDIAGAAFFNFGFITTTFGATSWGIDYSSGKMFEYSQRSYVIDLEKKTASLSPLDYVIGNYDGLREEIADQRPGERLRSLCSVYELEGAACATFLGKISAQRVELITEPHSLAMYRAIDRLAH